MTKQAYGVQAVVKDWSRPYLFLGGIIIGALLLTAVPALAALFDSGSSGADGAFSPTSNTALAVPPSGKFNFTTITIPVGVTVTFTPNTTNTPVTMLASGDVTIAGTINVSGANGASGDSMSIPPGGAGGPGGFAGGGGRPCSPLECRCLITSWTRAWTRSGGCLPQCMHWLFRDL